jgi:hypothetical protein
LGLLPWVAFLPVRVKGTQRGNEIHHRLVFSTTAVLGFEVSLWCVKEVGCCANRASEATSPITWLSVLAYLVVPMIERELRSGIDLFYKTFEASFGKFF